MSRPKTVYPDLPPRMIARKLKSGRVLYYYQADKKKIPLGPDLGRAKLEWAHLENSSLEAYSVAAIIEQYRRKMFPTFKHNTQLGYECYLKNIIPAFGHLPFDAIRPALIREYLDKRSSKISANREISLLSSVWNWARIEDLTAAPNACVGVRKNKEKARTRYVTDEEYRACYARAVPWLQDAMDLALLTGQRIGDVLRMRRDDIREGCLWITQDKTGARVGVEVTGELETTLKRILERPRAVSSVFLVADDRGQRVKFYRLWYALQQAKGTADWRIHDLRAKAATDVTDIRHAQMLLGHRSEKTTAAVYRRVRGSVVKPSR